MVIFELAAQLVIDVLLISTGELILYVVTLGKHRPVWKPRRGRRISKFIMLTNASALIGLGFWLVVGILIGRALLR